MMTSRKYASYVGTKVGRLQIEAYIPGRKSPRILAKFRCTCDCGRQDYFVEPWSVLRAGNVTPACGCRKTEATRKAVDAKRTHNRTHTYEYRTWASMVQRCCNPKNPSYPYYGGRGIRLCDAWRTSFATFADDMGPRPGLQYSIERADVNGNYEPGNCLWILKSEQGNNRRTTVSIRAFGMTLTQKQWSVRLGISETTLRAVRRRGLTLEAYCLDRGIQPKG